jgi:hypothetical protein
VEGREPQSTSFARGTYRSRRESRLINRLNHKQAYSVRNIIVVWQDSVSHFRHSNRNSVGKLALETGKDVSGIRDLRNTLPKKENIVSGTCGTREKLKKDDSDVNRCCSQVRASEVAIDEFRDTVLKQFTSKDLARLHPVERTGIDVESRFLP